MQMLAYSGRRSAQWNRLFGGAMSVWLKIKIPQGG
jgi:hypothetical protein